MTSVSVLYCIMASFQTMIAHQSGFGKLNSSECKRLETVDRERVGRMDRGSCPQRLIVITHAFMDLKRTMTDDMMIMSKEPIQSRSMKGE